ncbi:MAG: DUF4249 family protein [Bacteroidota bacterium]
MKKTYYHIALIFLSILTSCLDDIEPEFEFEEQVFISGLLTNEDDFVTVEIQKTVPVADTTFNAVNDAKVSLFTRDASNTVSLVSDSFNVANGAYTTSEMITPTIGNAYWVEVMLQDQTILKSEEEVLRQPIPILDMVKNDNTVRITFTGPIDEQNFYLIRVEVLKDGELISDNIDVFNDRIMNENPEKFLDIGNIKNDETVRVSINNINFSTFQFYLNVFGGENDFDFASLFLPINIVGNVTNIATNELALGNFGVAGISTMTMDFE